MQIVKYMFQPHGDERGMLVALEEFTDIPFRIKRVYYMYDTVAGKTIRRTLYLSRHVARDVRFFSRCRTHGARLGGL